MLTGSFFPGRPPAARKEYGRVKVKLKAFGLASFYLREKPGSIELPAGATIADLLEAVTIKDTDRDLSLFVGCQILC